MIRSDEFPDNIFGMERALGGSSVILSTLNMLSSPALDANGTFTIVRVERLVVDEASQIKIFEFMVRDLSVCRSMWYLSVSTVSF